MLNLRARLQHLHNPCWRHGFARLFGFTLLLLSLTGINAAATLADADQMEIIPLKHRPASTLEQQIQQLAAPQTIVKAYNNQIILRGSAQDISKLASLIEMLDQPLQQFLIYVRQAEGRQASNLNNRFSADVVRQQGQTTIATQGQIRSYSTTSNDNNTHQVRALEGNPVYIQSGQDIPYTTVNTYPQQYPTTSQQYQRVASGFYVTLRPIDEHQIMIDITVDRQQASNRYNAQAPDIDRQQVATTVQAELGEWVTLGGISQDSRQQESGLAKQYRLNQQNQYQVEVKIIRAN